MSDREESPDWLREFKAPASKIVTLSSSSESSRENYLGQLDYGHTLQEENDPSQEKKDAILFHIEDDSPVKKTRKTKSPKTKKDHRLQEDALDKQEEEPEAQNTTDKQAGPSVSSRLPLVFTDKVNRSKALIECDGDAIDLSGDIGAVGRIVFSNSPSGNPEMLLDLKGTIYKTTIVPSRTFCVVSVGQSEAKIEAIMNDFIQLQPQSNVFEAETMVEGTLEGFTFDSDEEGDKVPKTPAHQSDQNKENGDQANPKAKRKRKAEKPLGKANKKSKAAARPAKNAKKAKKSKK